MIGRKTLLLTFLCLMVHNPGQAQQFTRLVADPVVSDNRYSEGSAWGDINNDGYPDVFVPHLFDDNKNILFTNNGNGSFTQVVAGPVVLDQGSSSGGSFGDLDNDGDLDLFVSNYFDLDNFLYMNNGNGTFSKVTEGVIVNDGGLSFGSSLVDYDRDGNLDVFVVNGGFTVAGADNALYHGLGSGNFSKITSLAPVTDGGRSGSSSWCDYDNDGDPDLFVANGATFDPALASNAFYRNDGDSFRRMNPSTTGIADSYASNGSWGDYDNDGDFDLFITNFLGNDNDLYQNQGDGTFVRIDDPAFRDSGDSVSATWGDFDNDGDLDLYVTNDFNENNNLYVNRGVLGFEKVTTGAPVSDGGRSNGATWADYDRDGDLDLFVPNGQRPETQSNILYRNAGEPNNHWVNILCIGVTSNKSAIGTKVRVKAMIGGQAVWQMRQVSGSTGLNAQNTLNIEIGLGDAVQMDSVIITWPSGTVDVYVAQEANRFYQAVEGQGLDPVVTSVGQMTALPSSHSLGQNHPNPFNPTTVVDYVVARPDYVSLRLYNTQGQLLKVLAEGHYQPGSYSVNLDMHSFASGVYYYRLFLGNRLVGGRKMLFLR